MRWRIKAWTRSTEEEIIAALWMIAAITSFGFGFDAFGWICSIKAAFDFGAAIWFGLLEAIAGKRASRFLGEKSDDN
jgi:hypothetical protein